eukprot:GHVU01015780.1.p3 GENE.GHVU01015780.1~~GHVU01015780.1.p3  ORF type:complete len:103 (-),score=13.69 GHVU01015780.1:823-1131(-)
MTDGSQEVEAMTSFLTLQWVHSGSLFHTGRALVVAPFRTWGRCVSPHRVATRFVETMLPRHSLTTAAAPTRTSPSSSSSSSFSSKAFIMRDAGLPDRRPAWR